MLTPHLDTSVWVNSQYAQHTVYMRQTFISAISTSATACYRKEERKGERRGGGHTVPYCNLTCVNSNMKVSSRQESCKLLLCPVHVKSYVMNPHTHTHTQNPTLCVSEVEWRATLRSGVHFLL